MEANFNGGKLVLRCVAQIAEVYHQEAELQLETSIGPAHARGEYESPSDCSVPGYFCVFPEQLKESDT